MCTAIKIVLEQKKEIQIFLEWQITETDDSSHNSQLQIATYWDSMVHPVKVLYLLL